MFRSKLLLSLAALAASLPVTAATVNVNLSGATTGTTITAPGASFAQRFAGQTVSGTGITGSPTSPLALQAAGTLDVVSRSEERRVGKECLSVCRSRWSPYH